MPRIDEWRGVRRVHDEYERITGLGTGREWQRDFDRLKKDPHWPAYEAALIAEVEDRKHGR